MELIQIGQPPTPGAEPEPKFEIDPVCGMRVEPATAAGSFDYQGRRYYFCDRSCLEKFKTDPAAYLSQSQQPAELSAKPGAKYTCPMHPDVVQVGPGTCPKCGMALEPVMPAAECGRDAELVQVLSRLWIGAARAVVA